MTTRWIIITFVIALLALLISGWRYHGKGHPALSVGVGGLAGFCSGLAQTGGPPIVAYWLGRPIAGALARANIVFYFAMTDVISFGTYMAGRHPDLGCRQALAAGRARSMRLGPFHRRTDCSASPSETLFRRVCYSLIALAAIIACRCSTRCWGDRADRWSCSRLRAQYEVSDRRSRHVRRARRSR